VDHALETNRQLAQWRGCPDGERFEKIARQLHASIRLPNSFAKVRLRRLASICGKHRAARSRPDGMMNGRARQAVFDANGTEQ
jgi:hypothetical protein